MHNSFKKPKQQIISEVIPLKKKVNIIIGTNNILNVWVGSRKETHMNIPLNKLCCYFAGQHGSHKVYIAVEKNPESYSRLLMRYY